VPLQLFVGVILAYVILVGPVAFGVFRRRRTPLMSFVVAPLVGLGLTAAILLWGVFGEGLGIKRSVASVTLLDQGRHEAVTVGIQTLYAGLSPGGGLRPDVGTCVLPVTGEEGRAFLQLDLDAGQRLTSSIVPSRTPRSLLTVSRRRVRERLRFQRDGDGYRVLGDPKLTPLPQTGSLVLRDPAGEMFALVDDGHLAPLDGAAAQRAVAALIRRIPQELREAREATRGPHGSTPQTQLHAMRAARVAIAVPGMAAPTAPADHVQDLAAWLAVRGKPTLPGSVLPPGSYLALVESDPGFDDLGLETEDRLSQHLVLGTLGEDDLVD
jgi:hypothetical protein